MDSNTNNTVAIIYAVGETLLSLLIVGGGFYAVMNPAVSPSAIALASSAVMAVVVAWFHRRANSDTADNTKSLVSTIAASVTGNRPANPTN